MPLPPAELMATPASISDKVEDMNLIVPTPEQLAAVTLQDFAAQLVHQRLLAIADAQHWQAGIEDFLRNARPAVIQHRGGRTRQDDPLGLHPRERGSGLGEGGDFGIDPGFAHAAGDKLSDLRSEIDDQDGVGRLSG